MDARLELFLARPSEAGARALLLETRRGLRPADREVLRWLVTLPRWDTLPTELRELAAQALETLLPTGLLLAGLQTHAQGGQSHEIAWYSGPAGDFALVPGGRAVLGWDRRDVALTSLQRAAWNQANDDPSHVRFEQFLEAYLTPLREVELDPFLLEVAPRPALDYVEQEEERRTAGGESLDEGESSLALLARSVAREGFRLVTSDEWEHACRGGGQTLFRWGDEWPRGVPYGDSTDFTGHRVRNAFGLTFPASPYQVECVAGGEVFRGGDGGGAVCGGRPQPEAWYSFASAFAYPVAFAAEDLDELLEEAVVRRALSLPAAARRGEP